MNVFDLPADSPIFRDAGILDILRGKSSDHPQHLSLEDAKELINASAYASSIKRPSLVMVTIVWEMMPRFVLRDWMIHQTRLLEQMRKWLIRNDVPVAFQWVRELGLRHGPHTHILLHLPTKYWGKLSEFLVATGGFVARDHAGSAIVLTGGDYGTKTVHMRAGQLRYALKGLDPAAVCRSPSSDGGTRLLHDALAVDDRGQDRVAIPGKRCGTSRSIGANARKLANWRELSSIADLRRYLHP